MIVDLPEKFSMEGVAVIENGILKIMRYIAFSDIMYELTYQMKGRNICGYCKKEKEKKKMTLDHIKVNTRFTKKGKIMITNLENIICV